MLETGRIYKGIGGFYYVKTGRGIVECRARGRFRRDGITPTIGDMANIERHDDGLSYLVEILPRSSSFERPPVANLDTLVIVASAAPPVTPTLLIDRMTVVARRKGVEPIVVFNKCDLDHADEISAIYRMSGIETHILSAETGEGVDAFVRALGKRFCAFAGVSGVGKSSLLNRLLPSARAETGAINEKIGRGRHTTRHVELFELGDAIVADTPGFSSFDDGEEIRIPPEEIEDCFPEFEPYLGKCRFHGCLHGTDKGCAVREAVEAGEIARSRYENYLKILADAKVYDPYKEKDAKRR